MAKVVSVVNRRARQREARLTQPGGIRVGRRGRLYLVRNGVRVRDRDETLSAIGRKV